jgi:hypothetical protein
VRFAAISISRTKRSTPSQYHGHQAQAQVVAYQIVVMFMLAAAVALGAMLVVVPAVAIFVGGDAALRLDRLITRT